MLDEIQKSDIITRDIKDITMDEKKDTAASQGQNYKGRSIDMRSSDRVAKHDALAFAERKAEKLATAVYLVSDIVSEKDPMRWKLREAGIEIMSVITRSRSASPSDRVEFLRQSERAIDAVVSLLDIARAAKMVSEMNVTILRREYVNLRGVIESEWRGRANTESLLFSERFFDVDPNTLPKAIEAPRPIAGTDAIGAKNENELLDDVVSLDAYHVEKEVSDSTDVLEREWEEVSTRAKSVDSLKDTVTQKRPKEIPKVAPVERSHAPLSRESDTRNFQALNRSEGTRESHVPMGAPRSVVSQKIISPSITATSQKANIGHSAFTPRVEQMNSKRVSFGGGEPSPDVVVDRAGKDDRRKIILTLLGHSRDLTVKDIQKNIVGVSEKTVQRELLAMVADGTLQKKGERRWSRYSLKPGASI